MACPRIALALLCAAMLPIRSVAQSALMSALAESAPVTSGLGPGLGNLWNDPTSAPDATGALFSSYRASYSAAQIYHMILAFKLGPRWSAKYGSTEIGNLFDTSLTNQDPELANLRARTFWVGVDATMKLPLLNAALGFAWVGDDDVGDVHTSSIAQASIRLREPKLAELIVGLHARKVVGGSLPGENSGMEWLDLGWARDGEALSPSVVATVSQGSLWRYSETTGGVGVTAAVNVLSVLDLSAVATRYHTSFGTSSREWYRSIGASIQIAAMRAGVRFTSTKLGLGSGYGVCISYEPHFHAIRRQ